MPQAGNGLSSSLTITNGLALLLSCSQTVTTSVPAGIQEDSGVQHDLARTLPGCFPRANYTSGADLPQAQQPHSPPGADNIQLQQQYDTLLGDLAAQRQSQPRWPQRSRNSLMPLTSAQQLQQLQEEHLPIEQWPVQALGPLHQLHDLQHPMMPASNNAMSSEPLRRCELALVRSDASTAGPADAVLCTTATATEALTAAMATQTSIAALHTPSASITTSSSGDGHNPFAQRVLEHLFKSPQQADIDQSATLTQLPEDPFAQTAPKSHIPPARKHALPEELFCQHTSSAVQSMLPLSQPMVQQELPPPLDATSASVPAALRSASSAVRSPDAIPAELSQASVTQPAAPSQPTVSSPHSNQHDRPGFYPGATALSSRSSTVSRQPSNCTHPLDRQHRAAASADSLASDGSSTGDWQRPLLDSQQAELRLRASLVEWLADAVASRLAVAFQGSIGAGISAKPIQSSTGAGVSVKPIQSSTGAGVSANPTVEQKHRAGSGIMSCECSAPCLLISPKAMLHLACITVPN